MSRVLRLPAPAKLNLMLHITGKNSAGYHLLQTVFQLLDTGDELQLSANDHGAINLRCNHPDLANQENLVMRAAQLMQRVTGISRGADIYLDKRMPMGGGIGGGSSDCATTLLGLNHLWGTGLNTTELADLGLTLGADVPLFVRGFSAFAEGIGEQLTAIDLPLTWYLVIHPEQHVSTAEIFSSPSLTRDCEISTIRAFFANGGPFQGENVMQPLVVERYPKVKSALEWIQQYNPFARMTGSGSCLFAPFDNPSEASRIAALCKWPCFVAKGVNRSTAHQALGLLD